MNNLRSFLLIHILFILFLSSEAVLAVQQKTDEELLLRSELQLAQKTNIYFILNLEEKKVQIKARGVVLRDLEIKGKRLWGPIDTIKLYSMTGKAASSEPRRDEIIPENLKKNEEASAATVTTVEIKALELNDMPTSFILKFDDNFTVYVRPDNTGIITGFFFVVNSFNWYISQPLHTVWYSMKKSPYGALNLFLEEDDARALYWAIHEGADVLIYNPQKH